MALTTTNGRSSRRLSTMLATRSMAAASSTEVPPNFITITAAPSLCVGKARPQRSRQVTLHLQEFGVEECRPGGAANRVVRENGELVVEHAARTEAPNAYCHAFPAIDVETRLRAIRRLVVDDGLRGCQRKPQLLRRGMELIEGRDDLGGRSFLPQLYGNRLGMAIFDRHAIAVRCHAEGSIFHTAAAQTSQQLARFFLHLFLFFGDVRNYIAEDVE